MRRRVAALIALSGLAAVPAASLAAPSRSPKALRVSVKPHTGSARTRFTVSFRAAVTTGPAVHNIYRITASVSATGRCQEGAVANAPAAPAGSVIRVVLLPRRRAGWCAGTFRGQVWDVMTVPCPVGKGCPAIVPLPRMVGKFSFRVTRG